MKRFLPAAVVCFVGSAVVALGLRAEEETPGSAAPRDAARVANVDETPASTAEEEQSPAPRRGVRGRLPFYYGQVGLSDEQRETIYGIQGQYRPQIAELQAKLRELQTQRDAEIENVLSDEQKARLTELQDQARQRRQELLEQRRRAAAETDPADGDS